jgi:hypothetical protein
MVIFLQIYAGDYTFTFQTSSTGFYAELLNTTTIFPTNNLSSSTNESLSSSNTTSDFSIVPIPSVVVSSLQPQYAPDSLDSLEILNYSKLENLK